MKKLRLFVFLLMLAMTLSTTAFADILPWPENNDFFTKHEAELTLNSEIVYAAYGSGGTVEFYEAPNTPIVVGQRENLTTVYPCYIYTDWKGDQWGIVEFLSTDENGFWISGWCRLDDLIPLYKNAQFYEDYSEKFTGSVSYQWTDVHEEVYTYEYPGSGIGTEYPVTYISSGFIDNFDVSYTDPNGMLWATIYHDPDCAWFCLSDPTNDSLPFLSVAKTEGFTEPYLLDSLPTTPEKPSNVSPYLLIGIVGAVSILGALGIYLLGKKKRA